MAFDLRASTRVRPARLPTPVQPQPQLPTKPGPDIETASNAYRKRFAGAVGAFFLEMQTHALLSCLLGAAPLSILDVGGGHGQYSKDLIEMGWNLTVLGSSPEADLQIRPLTREHPRQCRFVCGDLEHFPFPDRSFDFVISFRLLSHADHWQTILSEMTRAARTGIVVDYPNRRSFNIAYPLLFKLKRALENDSTRTFTVFKDSEVEQALHKCGFHVDKRVPQFLLPMVCHRHFGNERLSRALEYHFRKAHLTQVWGSPIVLKAVRDEA